MTCPLRHSQTARVQIGSCISPGPSWIIAVLLEEIVFESLEKWGPIIIDYIVDIRSRFIESEVHCPALWLLMSADMFGESIYIYESLKCN